MAFGPIIDGSNYCEPGPSEWGEGQRAGFARLLGASLVSFMYIYTADMTRCRRAVSNGSAAPGQSQISAPERLVRCAIQPAPSSADPCRSSVGHRPAHFQPWPNGFEPCHSRATLSERYLPDHSSDW